MIGLAFAGLVVFGGALSAYASCSNPTPIPQGYATPCPVWSVSPASVAQSGSLGLTATPQPGTDYIYTTAYYAKGSTWLPVTLQGNNAAPSYSTAQATGSLPPNILSTLPLGTNYVVLWDWLWDATAGCYKGPGLNQCNTGTWRLQTFTLTQSTSGPQVSISPTTVTFPATQVGMTSAVQTFTITNVGNATLTMTNTFSGDFTWGGVGSCTSSLPPGANCTYSVKFVPTAVGTRTGQEIIADNAPGSPHIESLTGTGVAPAPTPTPGPTPSPVGCTSGCNNYYVSPAGSDSNSGTQTSPWATIAKCIGSFTLGASGAMCHVAAGTYSAFTVSRGGSSPTVRFVLQCDVNWSVPSSTGCKIPTGGSGISVNANNVDVVNWDIGGDPNMAQGIIVPCDLPGTGNINVNCGIGNSVHAIHNYVHNIAANTDCGGTGVGILFNNHHGPYFTDPQAISNRISTIGIQSSANCPNNLTAIGIYMNTGNFKIWNNIITDTHGTSIQVYGYDCFGSVSNNVQLRSLAKVGLVVSGDGSCPAPGSVTIDNNIFDNNHLQAMQLGTGGGAECSSSHPILVSNNIFGGNLGGDVINGLGPSCVTVSNDKIEAPGTTFASFSNTSTDNYQLKSGSQAVNGGTSTCVSGGPTPCVPSTDFSGKARTAPIDIGAYEQ